VSDEPQDRDISREEVGTLVQQAFELCATCAHTRVDHEPGCRTTWYEEGEQHSCYCGEFWPPRCQDEDGWRVSSHELSLGGSVGLPLNRRETSELWERLRLGGTVSLTLTLAVEGKGFKAVRDHGIIVGLTEQRKLRVEAVELGLVDPDTGELL
jgi:hypothetical protein